MGAECRSSTPCVPYAHEAPHPQRAERPPPGATRADLPPSPAGVPFSRSGASSLGTWAHMPGGGTGVRPPGGAREAGPKLRSQGPRRPRCGHRTPHRCPKTPFVGARLEQRAREAGAGAVGAGPGGRGLGPPTPGSRRALSRCRASARNARRPGLGGPAGAGKRPPHPAAAARELCRRLALARSSCSSFPGNFRPGIAPPGGRAAPPAQPVARAPPQGGQDWSTWRRQPRTLHLSWVHRLRDR